MRLQENHGLQNSPWGGGKPYLAFGLWVVLEIKTHYAVRGGHVPLDCHIDSVRLFVHRILE